MLTGDNDSNLTTKGNQVVSGGDKVRAVRREFESFTEHYRKKFVELLEAKYTLQGRENPKALALKKIAELKKQTKKGWRRHYFFTMQAIDKERVKMGLSKIHFP